MASSPQNNPFNDKSSPYFHLNSLIAKGSQGLPETPIRFNPENGMKVPIIHLTPGTDEYKKEWKKLPDMFKAQLQHLQSQGQHPLSAQKLQSVAYPKTTQIAENSGIKEKMPGYSASQVFNIGKALIEMKSAMSAEDENGISYPLPVEEGIWKRVEALYSKYISHKDLKLPNKQITVSDSFFYQKQEAGVRKAFFQVEFMHENVLTTRRVLIDPKDTKEIFLLRSKYSPLTRKMNEEKVLESSRRHFILPETLSDFTLEEAQVKPSDDPISFFAHQERFEKGHKIISNHFVEYAHPLNFENLSQSRDGKKHIESLKQKTVSANESVITFETYSDKVTSLRKSQNFFSRSAHQARIFYGINPRSGKAYSEMSYLEKTRLAQNYPLHFLVNAHLGEFQSELAPKYQGEESVLIHTRSKIGHKEYATFLQNGLEFRFDTKESIIQEIINQTHRYEEIAKGFQSTKEITLREPINAVGIHQKALSAKELTISTFIRIVALYLANSRLTNKIKLEFEYSPTKNQIHPLSLRIAIRYARNLARELRKRDYTLEQLVNSYCDDSLDLQDKEVSITTTKHTTQKVTSKPVKDEEVFNPNFIQEDDL